ncbi:MAG: tRNA preQ1(34) S-adenosylmethionine ribosyltransferase-isomerase QueA [Sphaerochaeta sp.]|jgi:S-adenosylmethionine:tRNA ribosyltransferase-isomerase|nr:tRNA preQ1(34) S-adenosylmethionine ribosyltransferase-isomerase QueA [Spirochaetales bacterium]
MTIKEYSFNLPEELIAQSPSDKRGSDRLMVVNRATGAVVDSEMSDFVRYLEKDSILVVNNSKVRKARLYATSETGGTVEFLFLEENIDGSWQAMVTKAKRQHVGKRYTFGAGPLLFHAEIISENEDGTRTVRFQEEITEQFFQKLGHVPLPPYIKRDDDFQDESRYQTVYAVNEGSVAAPTAGLHFTDKILASIEEKGCTIVPITLHVGPGTFLPVRTENLDDHHMHYERFEISAESAKLINDAKQAGRPIVATGTTSVRTLESAYDEETGKIQPGLNRTNLFIKPGYEWKIVDQLLTNFHTPESTLLVLVSTFAGKTLIDRAYRHAIDERYSFFSYGDAMFIR